MIRERLYTFVLELADERVTKDVDIADWRRSAVGLILKLFNTAMPSTDPSPTNLVMWRGLMPAHLEALTLSFESYLLFGSTDEQRLALLSQLLHLQTLKPSWPSEFQAPSLLTAQFLAGRPLRISSRNRSRPFWRSTRRTRSTHSQPWPMH